MTLRVVPLTDESAPAWDRFVDAHPEGTFFHRAGWADVLRTAFRHTALHAFVERDGAITGVLPLVHMKTMLFGNVIQSTPFCVYGGPIATDDESWAALDQYGQEKLAQSGATALEYRFRERPERAVGPGWHSKDDLYVTFRKPIGPDHAANLKAIPRKQRAMVRKAIDGGLESRVDHDVDRLHSVYAQSVRNLGTPVFGRAYFRLLAERFRDNMDVVTVFSGEQAVASVLNFYYRDEVLPYYGGGTREARSLAANDFMYWEVMRHAADAGCTSFDFGRSKVGTGAFSFKKNWGFSSEPIFHRYRLRSGASIPDHNPLNPKYRAFIAAWKRLPLPVANTLGPMIVRGVG